MADPHIKSLLERKIGETEARLAEYHRNVEDAQKDLVHLRGAIAIFDRDRAGAYKLQAFSLANVFKRGEVFGICQQAFAEHPAGLDTRSLATICLEKKNLDPDDRNIRRSMMQNIAQMMQVRKQSGQVEIVKREGIVCTWRLT